MDGSHYGEAWAGGEIESFGRGDKRGEWVQRVPCSKCPLREMLHLVRIRR